MSQSDKSEKDQHQHHHHHHHHEHRRKDSSELWKEHSLRSSKLRKFMEKAVYYVAVVAAALVALACFVVWYFDVV